MGFWKSPTRKLKSYLRLAPAERILVLHASLLLVIVGWALSARGFRRTMAMFRCGTLIRVSDVSDEASRQAVRQVSRAVNLATRNGLREPNCLRSALVLNYLLRRRGYDSELRIGVKREGELFEAHAWVELDDRVINDSQDVRQRFVPVAELSGAFPFL